MGGAGSGGVEVGVGGLVFGWVRGWEDFVGGEIFLGEGVSLDGALGFFGAFFFWGVRAWVASRERRARRVATTRSVGRMGEWGSSSQAG